MNARLHLSRQAAGQHTHFVLALNGVGRFQALQTIRRDSLAFLAADLMRVVLVRSNFLR